MSLYGQLGRMLESGLSLVETLDLAASHSPPDLANPLRGVSAALEGGAGLAEACKPVFPPIAVGLLQAAERTGGLPAAFEALSSAAALRVEVRRQIIRACILPLVLFTLVFFIPRAHLLFTGGWGVYLKASLVPYLICLGVLAALVWGLPALTRQVLGGESSVRILRGLPVVRGLYHLAARVRFCRNLAAALEAGLSVTECLDLAARATGDPRWRQRLQQAAHYLEREGTLHQALERVGLLDEDLLLAIATGERAGRLPESLEQQARLTQSTLTHRLNITLQVAAVILLLGTYVFVAGRVVGEMQDVMTGSTQQIDRLLNEAAGHAPPEVQKALEPFSGEAGAKQIEELMKHALDPAGVKKLPPDVRKHLE